MENELQAIKDFVSLVDKMENTNMIKYLHEKATISTKFSWSKDSGIKFNTNAPDPEIIALFLLYFRQVFAQDDRTNLNKICNIIETNKLLKGKNLKNIRQFREIYNKTLLRPADFKIIVGQEPVAKNVSEIINLFLYGEFFHNNNGKGDIINSSEIAQVFPLLWQAFLNGLIDVSRPIFGIRNNIKTIDLGKIKSK